MGLVFLTGMTGVGKTSVGNHLARRLGVPFVDLDDLIERAAAKPIAQIFPEDGESAFRDYESEALDVVAQMPDGVVALGAGALTREDNLMRVKESGRLVYLKTDVNTLLSRTVEWKSRPMVSGAESPDALRARLAELLNARHSGYERAHLTVTVDAHSQPDDVAMKIIERLALGGT